MATVSRRIFLTLSGATALAPAAGDAVQRAAALAAAHAPPSNAAAGYLFFNAPEAAFVEAAVLRLIPADDLGPSAVAAGVPTYIDRQLHGAWGAGERLYRSGPWLPGQPTQGYQLPFTPAELFRTALRGIREDLQKSGKAFDTLAAGDQ